MATRVVSPELIGRDAEMATLAGALDDARRGLARTVLVGGEAGIGKTRLLTDALDAARARAIVLAGNCIPIADGSLPFAPFVEAIRPLVPVRDAAEARPVPEGVAPDLALLTGMVPPLPGAGLRPEWTRGRIYETFLELLRGLARERPIVIAVEDLHWADASTLELLSFLARAGRAARLLLVLTFRSEELERGHPLLAWLGDVERLDHVLRLELSPLTRNEVGRQIAAILRRVPDPAFVDSVHARAEGNPFFVEELVAAGAEPGRLPPLLRDVLAARLDRVSDATLELLGVAAVIGRRVDHELLAGVAGLGERELDAALREAVASGLLVVDAGEATDRYAFRHALLAEAAAETVLPARRRRLHAAIAEALAASPRRRGDRAGHLAEIAHHWVQAGDPVRALPASLAAAAAALATGGYVEAFGQYQRALELWDLVDRPERMLDVDRVELLRRTAQAARLAGAFETAVELLRDAIARTRECGETTREGLLHERLGRALYESGAMKDALAAYERALELVPDQPATVDRIRVVAGYAQMLSLLSRASESVAVAEPALLAARAMGARQLEGHLLTTIGIGLGEGEHADRGIALLREALAIAREVDDVDDIFRAYSNLTCALAFAGRNTEAVACGLEGLEAARTRAVTLTNGAFVTSEMVRPLIALGRWDEALRLLRGVATDAIGYAWIAVQKDLTHLLTLRGDEEEAAPALEELERRLEPGADPQWLGPVASTRIELAIRNGDVAAGRRAADRVLPVVATIDDCFLHAWVLLSALQLEAAAAEHARAKRDRAGADESARRAEEHMAALRAHLDRPGSWRRASVVQAVALGEAEMSRVRGEPDPNLWRTVLSRPDGSTGVHEIAYARFRLAEALLATSGGRTTRDEAHAILAQAYEAAVMLGARPLRAQIEALAVRSRLRLETRSVTEALDAAAETQAPRRPAPAEALAAYGLTSREIEVLRLLAVGRTNRQIGEALFISESTAGVHVSHVLGKLEVRGRVEAATIAARLGIAE